MKNILVLIIFSFLIASCGTKKEMVVETPVVEEAPPEPQLRDRKNKPRVDLDQLIAQLGLSEAQEEEFTYMWNKTADDMINAREKNAGNRDAMRTNMMAIRDERQAGVKGILTAAQLTKYYEIMDESRKKMGGAPIKRGG